MIVVVEDDLIRRRKEKLSPEARDLFDDIDLMEVSGAEIGSPEFEGLLGRFSTLPAEDRQGLLALLDAQDFGLVRQAEEAQGIKEITEGAKRVFEEAHGRLRAEGKLINPNMTLREAYEILGFT